MMVGFFDRIKEATGKWYDSLTDRERRLMTILFICISVLIIFSSIFVITHKVNNRRADLAKNKERLVEIQNLEGEYLQAKDRNERAMMSIRQNDVSLFTFIQSVTSRFGLSVKDLNEQKRSLPKSNVVEISVRVNLTKLSVDKVTALLEAMEENEDSDLVKITKLKVSKRFDEPDLLDLQMTVSTWKSS